MDTKKELELPEGWFTEGNIETYRKLVSKVPENGVLVELGCWKGRSICSVASLIKKKCLDVYLVDSFTGSDNEVGQYADSKGVYEELNSNLSKFGIDENIAIMSMTTDSAIELWKTLGSSIDLLFIDADHSYGAVKQDIKNWLPMIRKGGIIAGHDFFREGVQRAVMEVLEEAEHEESIWFKYV